ncbi:MAG: DUF2610 domain-containing protein [Rickettsiales bacterium]|jgi:hypothetical protein|nr:DUF2610 domain-containing protein [Rickettsiales bacterium]
MVAKFFIPCDFNGREVNIEFSVGNPAKDQHPIYFQSKWLGEARGGVVPQEIMDSIQKIKEVADKEKVSFEDLCLYTINLANNIPQDDNKYYNKLLVDKDAKRI